MGCEPKQAATSDIHEALLTNSAEPKAIDRARRPRDDTHTVTHSQFSLAHGRLSTVGSSGSRAARPGSSDERPLRAPGIATGNIRGPRCPSATRIASTADELMCFLAITSGSRRDADRGFVYHRTSVVAELREARFPRAASDNDGHLSWESLSKTGL